MTKSKAPFVINANRRKLILRTTPALIALTCAPALALPAKDDSNDSKRRKLIEQLTKETGLESSYIEQAINQAQFDKTIIERIETPYESKTYAEYRPLFVHRQLADKGTAYLKRHAEIFEQAQKRYEVQPQVIAAILGMETRYGHYKGKDRVLDALYTLASGYPRRAGFFRRELGEFLLLCHEEKRSPASINGSYAGAFGTTQFIPSSFRMYSVDADRDGKRDVWESPEDIIHSVANYFHRYGWDSERPVAHWLPHLPKKVFFARMLHDETRKWRDLGELRKHASIDLPEQWKDDDKVALIQRETEHGKRTAIVHHNFYVITRWNRSYNYAMAITELAGMLGCSLCEVES